MTMEGIESLIDVVDNHDDSIGKQLEAFDRSDMERNQLIKVRLVYLSFNAVSLIVLHRRNCIWKTKL